MTQDHPHRQTPAVDLFCRCGQRQPETPAISMRERDNFTHLFANDFASAMIELRQDRAQPA